MWKQELGRIGELLAQQYISGQGYRIVATNARMKRGELDIVARDDREVLFAEVKTRTTVNYGLPEEGVTRAKLQHFLQASQEFSLRNGFMNFPKRYIVISLLLDCTNRVQRLATFSPFS